MLSHISDRACLAKTCIKWLEKAFKLSDFYNKNQRKSIIPFKENYIVFFESSDDESSASQVLDYSMARVQELFTNKLLSLACGISDIKLVYKVHPNSCTSPSISKRHQSIAELASRHPNIVLLTGNKIDPFILAEHSDLCIGLHSSVRHMLGLNIPVLAHSRSSSAPFSSYPIDFVY